MKDINFISYIDNILTISYKNILYNQRIPNLSEGRYAVFTLPVFDGMVFELAFDTNTKNMLIDVGHNYIDVPIKKKSKRNLPSWF